MNIEKAFLKLLMFWLPVPVTLLMAFAWWKHTGNYALAAYAVILPLSYGYIIPFIAINILNRWRFKKGLMMGGMYIHHGFMYASKLSLFGFLPVLLLKRSEVDLAASCAWVICTAISYAFTAWLQDALSLKYNYVEFGNVKDDKCKNESFVVSYAPACFTLIGIIYSTGLVLTYKACMLQHCSSTQIIIIFLATFSMLTIIPSFAFKLSLKSES